jgi:hypothetical protein
MNHVPNTQAIAALVEDVLPLVLAALPARLRADFRVHVVGSNDVPPWLLSLMATAPHVKFHGALSDQQVRLICPVCVLCTDRLRRLRSHSSCARSWRRCILRWAPRWRHC